MRRRYGLLLSMLLGVLLLTGWGKKQVELLNDKKLIDLDLAIEQCFPGADAQENETNADAEEETEDAEIVTDDRLSIEEQERTIAISIRGRKVTYQASLWEDMDRLKEQIRRDHSDKTVFYLVDDFAEAHRYRQVMRILSELEAECGLRIVIK